MSWLLVIEFAEGFLTVFFAALSAAVMQGSEYQAPNQWAIIIGGVGGVLAGLRKVRARLAPNGGNHA